MGVWRRLPDPNPGRIFGMQRRRATWGLPRYCNRKIISLTGRLLQIELRDKWRISAIRVLVWGPCICGAGKDIHRATAAEVLGLPLAESVSSEQRRSAKAD